MDKHRRKAFHIFKLFSEERLEKTFAKVFDQNTIHVLHTLASQGHIDHVEFTISTGKEAHVFRAVDKGGNYRAVKIYKIETSDFNNMQDYLRFDKRFANVKNEKRSIVFAWTQKEFSSLRKLREAGVNVPMPLVAKDNVLVMEFIGTDGGASPMLKDARIRDLEKFYKGLVGNIAKMLAAKMIHGDLSDYNILVKDDIPIIIDCGQTFPTTHPNAKHFYERDLKNLLKVIHRLGKKDLTYDEFYGDVKREKEKLSGWGKG
ncbi:MAG: serine protein kinase RIO [Candidatus Diapherotrites archaeon]|nr:serine protein kinase RIO [Candidatus Diapherotrites archaeon]